MAKLMRKIFDMISPAEEEYDEDDGEQVSSFSRSGNDGKVLNISKGKLVISCFKPNNYGADVTDIASSLISGDAVVLDLEIENSDPDSSRRIVDFLRGTVYAVKGKFVKVAKNTYVLTPSNVDINGAEVFSELASNGIYL